MTIDIWSDIMCPFCYIGKRKLEQALELFPQRGQVKIVWHSFQLDPGMKSAPGTDIYSYLAARKGQSMDWAVSVHAKMTETAKQDGLEYNFDKAVVANSYDAHRLIQMAKTKGLGNEAEERIFKAYFTDGADMGDHDTLARLGTEIGLNGEEVSKLLSGDEYGDAVRGDVEQAEAYGITGVPFFVLDNKYAISGAQPVDVFVGGLTRAWNEQEVALVDADPETGAACTPGGNCD